MSGFQSIPARVPPKNTVGVIAWFRERLFSNLTDTAISVFCIFLLFTFLPPMIDWAFISANFVGTKQSDCTASGACWVFIKQWFEQIIYGSYPVDQRWRVTLSLVGLILVIGLQFVLPKKYRARVSWLSFLLYPLIAFWLMGGGLGLQPIPSNQWGGFSLNILLAVAGILCALPLGIIWALGRRSGMPVIRVFSIASIEVFRGVPLITILFMGSVMLPLFFPAGTEISKLARAFIAITLFQSAYMAEVVRAGLQAVPKGQVEAAKSIGLGYWRTMFFVVLPQALKISIPNIVNTFIALFKDTTLTLIIGLFGALSIVKAALENSNWLEGHQTEGYIFVAILFGGMCYCMSLVSANIEKNLSTDHKR